MITEGGAIDYDDEKWDDLITFCGTGGWSAAAIESIGRKQPPISMVLTDYST